MDGFSLGCDDGCSLGCEVGNAEGFPLGCDVGRAVKTNMGQFELRGQRLLDMPKNDKPIAHTALFSAVKSTG